MRNFFYFSLFLSNSLLLIAFIFGITKGWTTKFNNIKWYIIYLGTVLTIEILNKFFIYVLESPNTSFTYPFYISIVFFTLSQMLIYDLKLAKRWRILSIIISSFLFIESTYLWYYDEVFSPSLGMIFCHLILIVGSSYILISNIKELVRPKYIVMIYSSLLLYFTVSLFLFLILDQLPNIDSNSSYIIWSMNNILSSILYGVSAYALCKLK